MKWTEYSVLTAGCGVEPVAALFHRLGSGGVMIEDPRAAQNYLQAVDEDKAAAALDLSGPGPFKIKAYFHEDRQVLAQIEQGLQQVQSLFACTCKLQTGQVQDEDWEDSWKKYYHAFRVGKRLVIKPSWEEYPTRAGEVVIEIDPGMAFGTGIHASTRFCLLFIDEYVQGGEKVIDAGCGSGILAMAAASLGATEVLAMDNDSVAVKIARQNIALNGLDDRIRVVSGDIFTDLGQQQADIIAANLTADVILPWLPVAVAALRNRGCLFASGIQDRRWPEVKQAMEKAGLAVARVAFEEDWVGVAACRL